MRIGIIHKRNISYKKKQQLRLNTKEKKRIPTLKCFPTIHSDERLGGEIVDTQC